MSGSANWRLDLDPLDCAHRSQYVARLPADERPLNHTKGRIGTVWVRLIDVDKNRTRVTGPLQANSPSCYGCHGPWGLCALATAEGSDRVILDPRDHPVRTGTYSRFAEFQQKLWRLLAECARGGNASVPKREPWGTLGPDTAEAIQRALHCPGFETMLSVSPARGGVATLASVAERHGPRADATPAGSGRCGIVLSFEATDFSDKPEWNFCQDSPKEDFRRGLTGRLDGSFPLFQCFGPLPLVDVASTRVTAGQGREIEGFQDLAA